MDKVKEKVIVSIWNISCMEVVINLQFKVRGKENTIPDARLVHAHWIFSGKKQKGDNTSMTWWSKCIYAFKGEVLH